MIKNNFGVKFAASILAISAITLSGCAKGKEDKAKEEKKEAGRTAQAVSIAQVSSINLNPDIVVAGQVLAQNEAQVYSTASGAKVMQLLVDVGQYVNAGQALARLDARQITADNELLSAQVRRARTALAEAQVQVQAAEQNLSRGTSGTRETALDLRQAQIAAAEAKSQYDRAMATTDIGALSREEVERRRNAWQAAEARLNAQKGDVTAIMDGRRQALTAAKARLEGAKSDLALAIAQQNQSNARQNNGVITAPVSGLITSRNVKVGEISGMGASPMFTIVTGGALEVNAEISESELGRLTQGMSAQFKAPDGTQVNGVLRQLPAQIDPQKRTGIAKFTLQPNPSVKSGVFLTGMASSGMRAITAIPSSSVLYDNQGSSVYVVKQDNSVTKQKVTLGARSGDLVELIVGPAIGQWVVTSGASFLAEGEKINPTKEALKAVTPAPNQAPANVKTK